MNKERSVEKLKAAGGVRGLANALGIDLNYGLDTSSRGHQAFSIQDREEVFGKNTISSFKPRMPFEWTKAMLTGHFLTPFIIVAIINTVLGLSFREERENKGWIDAAGIWTNVLVIVLSGYAMDYVFSQSRQLMNVGKDMFDVTVLRDGREQLIKNSELLVGDILVVTMDVTIAADGVLFVDNDLFINEEVVTGESMPIKKRLVEDPFCLSGTQVTSGSGRILVTSVGEDSEFGNTMKTVTDITNYAETWIHGTRNSYSWLAIAALCLGILSFIVLLVRWMVAKKGFPVDDISDKGPVQFLILAIVVIVVELPYGILLVVFSSYVYLAWKVAKDKIILHKPLAFDGMSSIDSICFDKTGTLTENRMTVVGGWFQGSYFDRMPKLEELDPLALKLITENASLNSEAFLKTKDYKTEPFVGKETECALLRMAKNFGVDYVEVRMRERQHIIKNYGFNRDKMMSSVIVKQKDLFRLYNKGAAELVLERCTQYIDRPGSIRRISRLKQIELEGTIERMAHRGLRTLALTYADLNPKDFYIDENGEQLDESVGDERGFAAVPKEDLVLLAIVGIEDPIREGVSEVVEQIKKAKITVRMITGDSLDTAKQVATECGILTFEGLALEGEEFRQRAEEDVEDLKRDLPRLQVLARSSPSDKQKLLELLKSIRERVAVCGDGTNDARALKESLVGIAIGTNSTEVARQAADVVILNDNISSILTFYLCSRKNWLSFCGYLQSRLSVTLVVWVTVLISVCVGGETPLNVHQFLWANFVIDTMLVMTFATESPPEKVPDDDSFRVKNYGQGVSYWLHIFLQSVYQIIAIVCTFYSLSTLFERYEVPAKDAFYYRYCNEGADTAARFEYSTVGPFCDQYLDCDHFTKQCTLFEEQRLDDLGLDYDFRDHMIAEYEDEHDLVKMRKNSLMFNIFIFMQLFNSLNSRKLFNEYNIFEGLFNSPLSCVIRITTIGLQLLIMMTPLKTLFNVTELNGWEWLYSIGVSAMVIPLSTFVRYDEKNRVIDMGSRLFAYP